MEAATTSTKVDDGDAASMEHLKAAHLASVAVLEHLEAMGPLRRCGPAITEGIYDAAEEVRYSLDLLLDAIRSAEERERV